MTYFVVAQEVIYPRLHYIIPRKLYHASIHHRTFTRLKFLKYDWSLNAQRR